MAPSIHIYNPDTDYALSQKNGNYTPPQKVVDLRRKEALFPAIWAKEGDFILLLDSQTRDELRDSAYYSLFEEKRLTAIHPDNIKEKLSEDYEIRPWGWNLSLRKILEENGVDPLRLPTEKDIETLKSLSHRRTAIKFQNRMNDLMPECNFPVSKEFMNPYEALDFVGKFPDVYLKMPWSSSGRGVRRSLDLKAPQLKEWIMGSIKKQGSIIIDINLGRKADFASEWVCRNGKAEYIGSSFFKVNMRGRYQQNIMEPQEKINNLIRKHIDSDWEKVVDCQGKLLNELIAPYYNGPLGIDMLSDGKGNINPCVEINLRMTMGIVAILRQNQISLSCND